VRAVGAAGATLLFYAFFYRAVVARWGPVVQSIARWLGLDTRHSVREVEAIGKLAAASVAQLLFLVGLALALRVDGSDLTGPGLEPGVLGFAAALGVGELALTSLICTAIVELTLATSHGSRSEAARQWAAQGRGGWMSYFLLTARAAPLPLALASICLYVTVEELIFRGILITVAAGGGAVVAVGVSAVIFVAVQAFAMPSRRAALAPMVGAAVVGVVHGVVFWHVQDVVPLAVAHLTFFGAALSLARRPPQATV
jgi:membrane protease YdiL (CAAX protease family)